MCVCVPASKRSLCFYSLILFSVIKIKCLKHRKKKYPNQCDPFYTRYVKRNMFYDSSTMNSSSHIYVTRSIPLLSLNSVLRKNATLFCFLTNKKGLVCSTLNLSSVSSQKETILHSTFSSLRTPCFSCSHIR